MAHSNQQAENLRQAANLVDQAVAAAEHAQGVKAVADAAQADAQAKSGIADMAKVQALSSLHVAGPSQSPPQVPPVTYAPGHPDRRHGGNAGGGSKLIAFFLGLIALVILLCFYTGWMAWLTAMLGNKADISYIDTKVAKVHTVATTAQATAVEAKALATTANTTAASAQVEAGLARKEAASAVTVANSANAKADTAVSTADSALKKAQAAVNAKHTHQSEPIHRQQGVPGASSGSSGAGANQTLAFGKKGCIVDGPNGEILADFLDPKKNPKGIVVKTGAECVKERDEFAVSLGLPVIRREIRSIVIPK